MLGYFYGLDSILREIRGFRPPTAGSCSANAERCERSVATTFYRLNHLRPFLPTVHIYGGGARLVLSGLILHLREILILFLFGSYFILIWLLFYSYLALILFLFGSYFILIWLLFYSNLSNIII